MPEATEAEDYSNFSTGYSICLVDQPQARNPSCPPSYAKSETGWVVGIARLGFDGFK
jgi:hypothetical protein